MLKVAIIGDVMLDTYHYLKQEKPAPEGGHIYSLLYTEHRPGAAANIADCLETLEWDVTLFAHIGNDQASKILKGWAKACHINAKWIETAENNKIRENTRYYAEKNCILRLDSPNCHNKWSDIDLDYLKDMDAVVLYDKGSLIETVKILQYCYKNNIKTYIDPSRTQAHYPYAYLVKANKIEYEAMSKGIKEDVKNLQKWQHLIITDSHNSLLYYDEKNTKHSIATTAQNAVDPIGAGDAFLSALITAIAQKIDLKESIKIAQKAGALALNHIGTYAPKKSELNLK